MSSPVRLGERLRHARSRHPQKPSVAALVALARAAGGSIKASRINRLELGYADASREEVALLAKALGISAVDLGGSERDTTAAPNVAQTAPAPVSPDVLAWRLPPRSNTDHIYSYRGMLLQELGRVRAWTRQPGISAVDAAALNEHLRTIETAIAATKNPAGPAQVVE